MDIARKARHIAVVGRSGTGKNTLANNYCLTGPHGRVIIADDGEFAHRLRVPLNVEWDDFFDACKTQRIICFDIGERAKADDLEVTEVFDELARIALELAQTVFQPRNLETLFVSNEIQKYTSAHSVPINFKNGLEIGRKWGFDTLSISQRPNRIHGDLLEQFTEIFFFKLKNKNSHKFGEYYGVSAEEQSALEDGHYIYLNQARDDTEKGAIVWPGTK